VSAEEALYEPLRRKLEQFKTKTEAPADRWASTSGQQPGPPLDLARAIRGRRWEPDPLHISLQRAYSGRRRYAFSRCSARSKPTACPYSIGEGGQRGRGWRKPSCTLQGKLHLAAALDALELALAAAPEGSRGATDWRSLLSVPAPVLEAELPVDLDHRRTSGHRALVLVVRQLGSLSHRPILPGSSLLDDLLDPLRREAGCGRNIGICLTARPREQDRLPQRPRTRGVWHSGCWRLPTPIYGSAHSRNEVAIDRRSCLATQRVVSPTWSATSSGESPQLIGSAR